MSKVDMNFKVDPELREELNAVCLVYGISVNSWFVTTAKATIRDIKAKYPNELAGALEIARAKTAKISKNRKELRKKAVTPIVPHESESTVEVSLIEESQVLNRHRR